MRAPLARCCRALLIRRIVYPLQVGHMHQVGMIIFIELDIVQILRLMSSQLAQRGTLTA